VQVSHHHLQQSNRGAKDTNSNTRSLDNGICGGSAGSSSASGAGAGNSFRSGTTGGGSLGETACRNACSGTDCCYAQVSLSDAFFFSRRQNVNLTAGILDSRVDNRAGDGNVLAQDGVVERGGGAWEVGDERRGLGDAADFAGRDGGESACGGGEVCEGRGVGREGHDERGECWFAGQGLDVGTFSAGISRGLEEQIC
jgi:hypothetical protein